MNYDQKKCAYIKRFNNKFLFIRMSYRMIIERSKFSVAIYQQIEMDDSYGGGGTSLKGNYFIFRIRMWRKYNAHDGRVPILHAIHCFIFCTFT